MILVVSLSLLLSVLSILLLHYYIIIIVIIIDIVAREIPQRASLIFRAGQRVGFSKE